MLERVRRSGRDGYNRESRRQRERRPPRAPDSRLLSCALYGDAYSRIYRWIASVLCAQRSAGRKPGGSPEGLPHITVRTLLEVHLQSQLQVAREVDLAARAAQNAKGLALQLSAAGAEPDPVEHVEGFGAEFHPD